MKVREGVSHPADKFLVLLPALALGWIEIMPYKLRIEQFVHGAELAGSPQVSIFIICLNL